MLRYRYQETLSSHFHNGIVLFFNSQYFLRAMLPHSLYSITRFSKPTAVWHWSIIFPLIVTGSWDDRSDTVRAITEDAKKTTQNYRTVFAGELLFINCSIPNTVHKILCFLVVCPGFFWELFPELVRTEAYSCVTLWGGSMDLSYDHMQIFHKICELGTSFGNVQVPLQKLKVSGN